MTDAKEEKSAVIEIASSYLNRNAFLFQKVLHEINLE